MMDCGTIVFNDDESWGLKVAPSYMGGYLSTINEGEPFDVRTELTENLMYFSQADSILYDGAPFRYTVMDTCDRGEYPRKWWARSTCAATRATRERCSTASNSPCGRTSCSPADDAVFHNLCLKYTGAHGIFGGDMGYDVSFCEIGWIGGSPQYYRYDDGGRDPGQRRGMRRQLRPLLGHGLLHLPVLRRGRVQPGPLGGGGDHRQRDRGVPGRDPAQHHLRPERVRLQRHAHRDLLYIGGRCGVRPAPHWKTC